MEFLVRIASMKNAARLNIAAWPPCEKRYGEKDWGYARLLQFGFFPSSQLLLYLSFLMRQIYASNVISAPTNSSVTIKQQPTFRQAHLGINIKVFAFLLIADPAEHWQNQLNTKLNFFCVTKWLVTVTSCLRWSKRLWIWVHFENKFATIYQKYYHMSSKLPNWSI